MSLALIASGTVDPALRIAETFDQSTAAFQRATEAPPAAIKLHIRLG